MSKKNKRATQSQTETVVVEATVTETVVKDGKLKKAADAVGNAAKAVGGKVATTATAAKSAAHKKTPLSLESKGVDLGVFIEGTQWRHETSIRRLGEGLVDGVSCFLGIGKFKIKD